MPMDDAHHHGAHYTIAAVLISSVVGLGLSLKDTPSKNGALAVYDFPQETLNNLPFGKCDYEIVTAPGSGHLPEDLRLAVATHFNNVHHATIAGDIMPHYGLWVSPDNEDGRKLALALDKALVDNGHKETVRLGDAAVLPPDTTVPCQIGVGTPTKP